MRSCSHLLHKPLYVVYVMHDWNHACLDAWLRLLKFDICQTQTDPVGIVPRIQKREKSSHRQLEGCLNEVCFENLVTQSIKIRRSNVVVFPNCGKRRYIDCQQSLFRSKIRGKNQARYSRGESRARATNMRGDAGAALPIVLRISCLLSRGFSSKRETGRILALIWPPSKRKHIVLLRRSWQLCSVF